MQVWSHATSPLSGQSGIRYLISEHSKSLGFEQALRLLATDRDFRAVMTGILTSSPYPAFRWETPALDIARAARPFEFTLIADPSLERTPDPGVFSGYFSGGKSSDLVAAVPNLGKTSILLVPRHIAEPRVYTHLACFLRGAPAEQVDALWQLVGETVLGMLSEAPLWLSTAGAGAAWLHVRVDRVPKYYVYRPYATADYNPTHG